MNCFQFAYTHKGYRFSFTLKYCMQVQNFFYKHKFTHSNIKVHPLVQNDIGLNA